MKRILLFLTVMVFTAALYAQTTITTPWTGNNQQEGIAFNLKNNNASVGVLSDVTARFNTAGVTTTVEIWYKPGGISGPPGAISVANGWTMATSNTRVSSTTMQSLFDNLCLSIPAGATYGIYIWSSNVPNTYISYQTLTAGGGVQTFSGAGFDLTTGDGIGYGGLKTGPTFTPRGFAGSVQVYVPLPNDVGVKAITSPGQCFGPNMPVTIQIKNYGLNTQTNVPVTAKVTFPNLTTTTLTGTYVGSIPSCGTVTYTFSPNINTSALGNYTIKAYTQLVGDGKNSNDTTNGVVVNNSLSFPYSENFNAGTTPAGYVGLMGFGIDDEFVASQHGVGNSGGMYFNLYDAGAPNTFFPRYYGNYFTEELPKFGVLPPNAMFTFDYRLVEFANYNNAAPTPESNLTGNDYLNLQVSTDCGMSWNTVKSINVGNHIVGNTFTKVNVNLSAYGGQVCKFRFEGITGSGGSADYFVDIDNINIESKTINFSPTAVFPSAPNGCSGDSLKVVVYNKGGLAKDSVRLNVNVTGSMVANFNTLYLGTIAPLDSVVFNFGPINLPAGGIINIRAITSHPADSIKSDDTLRVNGRVIRPLPVLTLLPDTVCITDSATIGVSGGTIYDWGMYGNTQTIKVFTLTPQYYHVTVTDGFGCKKADSVYVGVRQAPIVDITSTDSNFCQFKSINLTAAGAATYLWNNGQTTNPATYSPSASMMAKVVGTDIYGCIDSAQKWLTMFPTPIPIAKGDTICEGSFGTLSASGGTYYDWGSLGTSKIVQANPTTTTVYTVTVSDLIGCTASTTATIVVKTLPTTVITNDSFCNGKSATLSALGGVSYNWGIYGTTSSVVVSPSKTTRFPVLVKGPNGCEKLEYAWAYLREKPSIIAYPDTVCKGQTATISAGGGITYNWGALGSTPTIQINNVTASQSIPVTITDIHTCTNSGNVNILMRNEPYLSVNNPTICQGANVNVTATTFIAGSTYAWSGSGTGPSINVAPTATTEYKVTATDPFGCTVEGKAVVTVKDKPLVKIGNTVPKESCDDNRAIGLEAQPIGGLFSGTNVAFATFYPRVSQIGKFMIYYTYNEPGNNGCEGKDSVEILVKSCKVTTAINGIAGLNQLVTYPIPFSTSFNVEVTATEVASLDLQIVDINGKIVQNKTVEISNGVNKFEIQTGDLSSGKYLLKVVKGNEYTTIPLMKE